MAFPIAAALLALAASACASDKTHDTPLVDVRPQKLGLGDRLIVEGVPVRARSGRASPFAVLRRGYSITRRVGETAVVLNPSTLAKGARIETLVDGGRIESTVDDVDATPPDDTRRRQETRE